MYDAIVVGGGIVGASVGYHLAREGVDALLIDRDDPGRATDAGAGIVSVGTSNYEPRAAHRFAVEAARYYPRLVEMLERHVDDVGFDRPGLLAVARRGEQAALHESREVISRNRERTGYPAAEAFAEVDPDEAEAMVPPLTDVRDGYFYRQGGRVDGGTITRALVEAGKANGLETMVASVEELPSSDGSVDGVVVDDEAIPAAAVVVAGGAWSSAFAADLGVEVPIEPQRGQIVHLDTGRDTAEWPILKWFRDHYLVPWPDGRVSAGATRESGTGFAPHATAAGVREVLDEALGIAPGLADAELVEVRVGLRPLSADGRPILGKAPLDGAFLATGHGPSGLTLGPFSGKIVADLVLGSEPEVDCSVFAPDRFA